MATFARFLSSWKEKKGGEGGDWKRERERGGGRGDSSLLLFWFFRGHPSVWVKSSESAVKRASPCEHLSRLLCAGMAVNIQEGAPVTLPAQSTISKAFQRRNRSKIMDTAGIKSLNFRGLERQAPKQCSAVQHRGQRPGSVWHVQPNFPFVHRFISNYNQTLDRLCLMVSIRENTLHSRFKAMLRIILKGY